MHTCVSQSIIVHIPRPLGLLKYYNLSRDWFIWFTGVRDIERLPKVIAGQANHKLKYNFCSMYVFIPFISVSLSLSQTNGVYDSAGTRKTTTSPLYSTGGIHTTTAICYCCMAVLWYVLYCLICSNSWWRKGHVTVMWPLHSTEYIWHWVISRVLKQWEIDWSFVIALGIGCCTACLIVYTVEPLR